MGRVARLPRASAAAALAISLGAATASCMQPSQPDGLVASPGPDSPPAQVVQALVDGINARDANLVRELTTPEYGDSLIGLWFDGGYLTEAIIGQTLEDDGGGTGDRGDVTVLVEFTPVEADPSLPNGSSVTWSFLLTESDGGWLVYAAGQG